MNTIYCGHDHIKDALNLPMSDFGKKVADILGQVYRGIYHLNQKQLKKVNWSDDHYIDVVIHGEMATWDFAELTLLVLLCHEQAVRCAITAQAPGYLRLIFHPRKRTGCNWEMHPTIEEAIELFKNHFSLESSPQEEKE